MLSGFYDANTPKSTPKTLGHWLMPPLQALVAVMNEPELGLPSVVNVENSGLKNENA